MKLLSPDVAGEVLPAWDAAVLERGGFSPPHPGAEGSPTGIWLERALTWSLSTHPRAETIRHASHAGLLGSLLTGWYGGFGTEDYDLEEKAESLILSLAGGRMPAPDGGIIGVTPPLDTATGEAHLPLPEPVWTRACLALLEELYFLGGPDVAYKQAWQLLRDAPRDLGANAREGMLQWWHGWRGTRDKMQSVLAAFVSTKEAAALLGVNDSRVRQLIRAGRLPATKQGHDLLIDRAALDAVRERKRTGRPPKQKLAES